ncbi:MAG: hypothetical protein M0Q24_01505 [Sulfurimonas sp.]|uniref:hypothetical protein n=1 Tax=Sulfurimonas sp. TaxID=2022749 RepID=UPI0025E95FEB|nr:hypothetical protein [Sulfurimonas sp.]MCK9490739.1 hypothetical protein [Sulfurimonas sp.]
MNKFIEKISNNYWQLLVFIVIFVGYITFSFYMGINGFSFVDIDIKQIVGLGLLSGISIVWVLFFSLKQIIKINLSALFIISFAPLLLFKIVSNINYEINLIYLAPAIIIIGIFVIANLSEEHNYKKSNGYFAKDNLLDKVLIPASGTVLILTQFDVSLIALFLLNFYYLYIFNKYTNMQIGHKIILVVVFILFQPLLSAIIINQTGLSLANFDKQYISIKQNDKNINGILIYQNQQSFFIHENNSSTIVAKSTGFEKATLKRFDYKNSTPLSYIIDIRKDKSE